MPESSPIPLRDLLGEIDANAEKVWPEDRGARIAKCSSEALARVDEAVKHLRAFGRHINNDMDTSYVDWTELDAALAALVGDNGD